MISKDLKQVILTKLKLTDFDLAEETLANQVPGWDSLSHIDVICAIEDAFKIRFKMLELLKMKNIGELQALVDAKLTQNKRVK